jgi:hypothetical protein
MRPLPSAARLTVCELVTFLAFGRSVKANALRRLVAFDWIRWSRANAKDRRRKRLGKPWRKERYLFAASAPENDCEQKLAKAGARVLDAMRAGRLVASGRKTPLRATDPDRNMEENLDSKFLKEDLDINVFIDGLQVSRRSTTRNRAPRDLDYYYRDVTFDSVAIKRLLRKSPTLNPKRLAQNGGRPPHARATDEQIAKLDTWTANRVKQELANGRMPSRGRLEKEARDIFPDFPRLREYFRTTPLIPDLPRGRPRGSRTPSS